METKMTKGGKQLAIVDAKTYAIADFDEAQLREVVEVNLGGEKSLTEFDLEQVRIPSGGGVSFNIEGPDGAASATEIVGVIVCHQNRRTYWEKGINESDGGSPPDCWSPDGVLGYGSEAEKCGGQCARCPKAQFGSGVKDGKPTKGQACNQKKALFIMKPDSILPTFFPLPPTSLGAFKSYMTGLIGKRLPVSGVVTKITLVQEKNSAGTKYAEAKFEIGGLIEQGEAKKFAAFGKMFGDMFRPTIPNSKRDETVTPTVEGTEVVDRTTGEVRVVPVADAKAAINPSSAPAPKADPSAGAKPQSE